MMAVDFVGIPSLGRTMDEEQIADRADLISRLFLLLTIECEKGAALAVDGQGRGLPLDRRRAIASRLIDTSTAIRTIADAISILVEGVETPNAS